MEIKIQNRNIGKTILYKDKLTMGARLTSALITENKKGIVSILKENGEHKDIGTEQIAEMWNTPVITLSDLKRSIVLGKAHIKRIMGIEKKLCKKLNKRQRNYVMRLREQLQY